MTSAIDAIDKMAERFLSAGMSAQAEFEVQNMLIVGRLIALSALERRESRGVHYRTDYRSEDAKWLRRLSRNIAEEESILA